MSALDKHMKNPYLPSWEYIPDGTLLGMKPGDDPQFDPAVLTEGDNTYLYTGGVCFRFEKEKGGAMGMRLDKDMLTVLEGQVFVVPSAKTSRGTGFEDHDFFEASSIRKFGDHVSAPVRAGEKCKSRWYSSDNGRKKPCITFPIRPTAAFQRSRRP